MVVISKLLKDRIFFAKLGIHDYVVVLLPNFTLYANIFIISKTFYIPSTWYNGDISFCKKSDITSWKEGIFVAFIVMNLRCHLTFIMFPLDLKWQMFFRPNVYFRIIWNVICFLKEHKILKWETSNLIRQHLVLTNKIVKMICWNFEFQYLFIHSKLD